MIHFIRFTKQNTATIITLPYIANPLNRNYGILFNDGYLSLVDINDICPGFANFIDTDDFNFEQTITQVIESVLHMHHAQESRGAWCPVWVQIIKKCYFPFANYRYTTWHLKLMRLLGV